LRRLVYPTLGDRLIHEVRRGEINAMLDKIEDERGARSADLALQYLRRTFNWYAIQTDTFASPIIKGMGSRYGTAENRRTRILSDDELRAFWKASDPASGNPFHGLIRFLLLTGCRLGEAAGLTWDEIDDSGVWHLPAARHKNKTDVSRPLSKAALALVENRPRIGHSPYVFAVGRRPLSSGWHKAAFAKRCGVHDWRLHDLRRTCRTLLSRAGVDVDIAERCLGHALPNIRATNDRHTYEREMRHAVEKLAALIERIVSPSGDTVVTPLRRRR
jgi:integrase